MRCFQKINLDQVLDAAQQGLETAGGVGIPGLDYALVALIALISKIQEMRANTKDLIALKAEIEQLVNMVKGAISNVKNKIDNASSRDSVVEGIRNSSNLAERVGDFTRELKGLDDKATALSGKPWWLRFICSSQDATKLEELRDDIEKCRQNFESKCLVAINASVEEILERLNNVEEIIKKEADKNSKDRDNRILWSLPHANASYQSAVIAMKSKFLQGTRIELFQKIDEWVKQRSQESELPEKAICILTGDAGTGKSTIACEFARRRDVTEKDYGASFFFVRGEKDLDSTRLVFPTLAYQLARSQSALYPHIVEAAREHLKGDEVQQMELQAPSLIHGPIRAVGDIHRPMVLIIDGLDECCKSREMRELVRDMLKLLIESLQEARFPLRIFFTSHPNSFIENTLQQSKWASQIYKISLHDLSPESVQQDMTKYIRDKFEKLPSGRAQALLQQRPEVAEGLAKRAGGLFVYAKTTMDFLGDYPHFIENGLDNLISGGSSKFATKLEPLDDLYLTILETAFPPEDQSWKSLPLRSTLGNLAFVQEPMSLPVLEKLTGVSKEDFCAVLNRLRAVVLFDEEQPDEKVRATHTTFSQFLVDPNRCMSEWYYDLARHHQSRLALQCLGALLALEENMCRLPSPGMQGRADVPDLTERLGQYVPEHLQYACTHWADHLKDACLVKKKTDTPGTECQCWKIGEALEKFIDIRGGTPTKLRAWVEVMANMGRLDTVIGALDAAQAYLKDKYQEVKSLLVETRKLVVDHYSEIEKRPYTVHQF